uniref:Uncharacterized protein n=1 Tax=Solibacter usitatus (strain Ellin6076) TaxID=234267 RepID=Q01UE7_SOLUE
MARFPGDGPLAPVHLDMLPEFPHQGTPGIARLFQLTVEPRVGFPARGYYGFHSCNLNRSDSLMSLQNIIDQSGFLLARGVWR